MAASSPLAGANVYPWDVVGDPAAPDRYAGLGLDQVTLAAAYHSTRALTPFHPRHRIVPARHAAVYYRPQDQRWRGRRLRPVTAAEAANSWSPDPDAFLNAADRLRAAGLGVNAWVVVAHNTYLGEHHPESTVMNAYGDRYPWALCISRPEVREYSATLAREIASLPGLDGIELESCGWYGFEHLSAHDKTTSVVLGPQEQYLVGLCFCSDCLLAMADHDVDGVKLRADVRRALDDFYRGATPSLSAEEVLGGDRAKRVLAMRAAVSDGLRAETIGAIRDAAGDLPVLLHSSPDTRRMGANVGLDPATALGVADGLFLSCWGPLDDALAGVRSVAAVAPSGRRIVAGLLGIGGMGADLAALPSRAVAALDAGANEIRLYHAGLASAADLAAMLEVITVVRAR